MVLYITSERHDEEDRHLADTPRIPTFIFASEKTPEFLAEASIESPKEGTKNDKLSWIIKSKGV